MKIQQDQSQVDYCDVFEGKCEKYDILIIINYSQMTANGKFYQDGIFEESIGNQRAQTTTPHPTHSSKPFSCFLHPCGSGDSQGSLVRGLSLS